MAPSDHLAELAKRTKEAEARSRAAASEARDELRSTVEQASGSAQRKALEEAGRDPVPGLRKQLSKEFIDQPEAKIDEAVKQAFDRLTDVKIREFVPLFAWRHAREHLRRGLPEESDRRNDGNGVALTGS